jgi:erythronate-4-phosphate dehydrogenase
MTSRKKIICDNKIPFLKGVMDSNADVQYFPPSEITGEIVKDADALIIRTRTKCNSQLLSGSSVKIIATATIGYDHIDTLYCEQKKIKWLNAPGCNSTSVMQYISSVLVSLAEKKKLTLDKMTIGVVGVGNVGSKIAHMARLLGMKVLLNDPPRMRVEGEKDFVSLDELIRHSDIITFHVPLIREGVDKTYHMVDEFFFSKFNGKKIFINSSRGEVVESLALKNAIKNGIVESAVLDVWEKEPEIDLELLSLVDIATPHIAGYSADGKANGTSVCVNAVNTFLGLGLALGWYPSRLPVPEAKEKIFINCESKSEKEILAALILHTYDVLRDDRLLRGSVETFEKQRGNYPVRREFSYFSVEAMNCSKDMLQKISRLGFRIDVDR